MDCKTQFDTKWPSVDSTQTNSKLKRKQEYGGYDCNICNCKKTKCLKFYCDCFAAGEYCLEDCACLECFNRPDYDDLVSDARQCIESRNPIAFPEKVVPCVMELPKEIEGGNHMTQTTGRHKRGCHCKKSMCLKNYCECFKARVGCSLGCGCEGCENSFGRKEDRQIQSSFLTGRGMIAEMEHDPGRENRQYGMECEEMEVWLQESFKDCRTQLPLLDVSDGSYAHEPEFLISHHNPSAELCPSDSIIDDLFKKARRETLAPISYDSVSEGLNAVKVDPSPHKYDEFFNTLSSDPWLGHLDSSHASVSETVDSNSLQPNVIQGSSQLSADPLYWNNSWITPLRQFCDNSVVEATSPHLKFVFPPHTVMQWIGPSSSPASSVQGYKYQSVPSFPPLEDENSRGDDT